MISAIQLAAPQYAWAVLLGLAALLTAIVWLYRPQLAPLKAKRWWGLLVLRLLALSALALSLLKPTVPRPPEPAARGVVAILIDQSRSMSVADATRTPAELVQLAAALGELPPDSRPTSLLDLRAGMVAMRSRVDHVERAIGEVGYARVAGRSTREAEARLLESRQRLEQHAAAMSRLAQTSGTASSLADAIADLANVPVRPPDDWARSWLERIGNIIEQLDQLQIASDEELYRTNLAVRAVCDVLGKAPRVDLARRAIFNQSGLLAALKPTRPIRLYGFAADLTPMELVESDLAANGAATNIDGAIRDARHALSSQNVRALIVFSDGRQVGAETSAAASWPGVPIYSVQCAASRTRDVAIARLLLPDSAFVGENVSVQVDVNVFGDGIPDELPIGLSADPETHRVVVTGPSLRARLPVKFDRAGPVEVSVQVPPISGEATTANNRLAGTMRVFSQPLRVALLGSGEGRDLSYIRNSLGGSPLFALTDRTVPQPDRQRRAEMLLSQDLLILKDVPRRQLEPAEWDAVNRAVAECGASLLVIASDPSIASEYSDDPVTAGLLPWRGGATPIVRAWPGETPVFRVVPASPEAAEALDVAEKPEHSLSIWDDLPGIYRFLSMPQLRPGVRTLLKDRDSGEPILTEHRVGLGRVMVLGIDETWRWRATMAAGKSDRFWSQLARLAAPQPYAATDGVLSLDVSSLDPLPQQPLPVRARVDLVHASSDELEDSPQLPTLQVVRDGQVIQEQFLPEASPGAISRFDAELAPLTVGEYEVRLLLDDHAVSLPVRVRPAPAEELDNVTPDPEHMRQLVSAGGQAVTLSDLPELIQSLQSPGPTEPASTELRLWDSPYLFLLVLACLGAEWALRRKAGLP